jgi:CheY-like chemotaxis protein
MDVSVMVSGDPGRLQQVFWNLLSNSVKFTPKQGSVRVVMERVNSHIEVSVIDNGQGMSQAFLAHAFDRFRQSDSASTRETAGLGLGLSICKSLVEMHGGSIEARSEGEGRGSTFVVKLPVVVSHAQEDARVHPRTAVNPTTLPRANIRLDGLKVLVVDDEADVRDVLSRILRSCGADVIEAATASDAVRATETDRPGILISDVGMPGEDGYELIRRVRMLGESGSIPAIALTAFSRLEDRTRAMLAGFQIHLAKPIESEELIVTVASLAGRLGPIQS